MAANKASLYLSPLSYNARTLSADRPPIVQQETDQILSYYQSADAAGVESARSSRSSRQLLSVSSSVSSTQAAAASPTSPPTLPKRNARSQSRSPGRSQTEPSSSGMAPTAVQRRTSQRSAGASDNRRLAIVQLDDAPLPGLPPQLDRAESSSSSSIKERRGFDINRMNGLAIVGPPDADMRSYKDVVPPSSAPATGDRSFPVEMSSPDTSDKGHKRAASEAVNNNARAYYLPSNAVNPPRRLDSMAATKSLREDMAAGLSNDTGRSHTTSSGVPDAKSSDPKVTYDLVVDIPKNVAKAWSKDSPVVTTPQIGEGKNASVPVSGPIVVGLSAEQLWQMAQLNSSDHTSPSEGTKLDAQLSPTKPPGNLPPPRPPRRHSPSPRITTATLNTSRPGSSATGPQSEGSRASTPSVYAQERPDPPARTLSVESDLSVYSNDNKTPSNAKHTREGAFPSHSAIHFRPSQRPESSQPPAVYATRSSPSKDSTMQKPSNPQLTREASWVSVTAHSLVRDGKTAEETFGNFAPMDSADTPPPLPQRTRTANLPSHLLTDGSRRFASLPRPPSEHSMTRASSQGSGRSRDVPEQPIYRTKIVSTWPDAMYCKDVLARPSSRDRAAGYAHKINELTDSECGLEGWMNDIRRTPSREYRVTNKQNSALSRSATLDHNIKRARHVSGTSSSSEVTFPMRQDATLATDLTTRPNDLSPHGVPPALPYPSLARAIDPSRQPSMGSTATGLSYQTSLRSNQSSLSSSKSIGSVLFSSLGRKTSLRREKVVLQTPPSAAKLGKLSSSRQASVPRPVQVEASPALKGGPRAAPGRERLPQGEVQVSSPTKQQRRPSVEQSVINSNTNIEVAEEEEEVQSTTSLPSPEFIRRLDHMADVLPHVDRDVLAHYLRRCGHDILAIGAYLEDERNGSISLD